MKTIGKFPIEVFCHDYEDRSDAARLDRQQQYCRYIKGTCVKPRKSEPDRKVGICTLGATVNHGRQLHPVMICPQRLKEESMFEAIRQNYLRQWSNVKWVKEVNIGVGGSVDYVAVEVDDNDVVTNFLCVELQAAGTTGTPYQYVEELRQLGHYTNARKRQFGINWANEFSKTMMQQAYKKGKIMESWGRKIVFVLQDLAMQYLKGATDCSLLTNYNPQSPVDFCTFALQWDNANGWHMVFDEISSTTIDGISLMLGGASVSSYPTVDEFIVNIVRKGIADGVLENNRYTKAFLQ